MRTVVCLLFGCFLGCGSSDPVANDGAGDAGSSDAFTEDRDAPFDGELVEDGQTSDVELPEDGATPDSGPTICEPGDPAAIGDTSPCTRAVYPDDAFYDPQGGEGRIIDVTRPPFGAIGDGIADDTEALRAAYDFVMDEIDRVGWDGFWLASTEVSYVLYLPKGTYRVTDTIIYNGPVRMHPQGHAEGLVKLRIIGESREDTVIRLDPNVDAFGAGKPPRPVVSFGQTDFNNVQADNSLRNLTVRVGAGNPSAVGVKFGGANSSDVRNVAIVSDDPAHAGAVGLDNSIGTVLSYQRDLVIDGFDYGIQMTPYHFTRPTLEHVSVQNQRLAGVHFVDGTGSVRALSSNNTVPAVLLSGPGSHAVVIDSELVGGASSEAAIEVAQGHLFARNVQVDGYGSGVVAAGETKEPGSIDEFVSDQVIRFSDATPAKSLNLPIQESPRLVEEQDLTKWVRPAVAGDGSTDAAPAVQAAMDSGLPTVYFPGHEYRLDSTVTIPCSVEEVQFLYTTVLGDAWVKFEVEGPCSEPLRVRDATIPGGIAFDHVGPRTLVLDRVNSTGFPYRNSVSSGRPTTFLNMVTGVKSQQPFHDQDVFLRGMNAESLQGQLVCENADCWVLGFKSEKSAPVFQVRNGGRLEVLGGIINQYTQEGAEVWPGSVAAININSSMSLVAATNGPDSANMGFEFLVKDTQGATTRQLRWDSGLFPPREGREHQSIIPLYVSY